MSKSSRVRGVVLLFVTCLLALPSTVAHADPADGAVCAKFVRLGLPADQCDEVIASIRRDCDNGDTVLACLVSADGANDGELADAMTRCVMTCQEAPSSANPVVAPPGVEKACQNLMRLVQEAGESAGPDDLAMCVSEFSSLGEQCANADAVTSCLGGAASIEAFLACFDQCEQR